MNNPDSVVANNAFAENPITGSIVALVTPLTVEGAIDWAALEKLIDWHVNEGTDAIVAVGTTGESATLSMDEHHQVIQQVVRWVNGRLPVIGGTGANSTQEAIELTQQAEQAGVEACLLVTPYYNKPTQEGLYRHFQAVAGSVAAPLLLYNVPGRTAVDMTNETVMRLAEIENIIGIKDATGDLDRGRQLLSMVPEGFAVYSGDDFTATELIISGAQGNISVTANVMPKAMQVLVKLARRAQHQADEPSILEAARTLQTALMPLHQALFLESNPIPVKWALKEMGMIDVGIRLPLTPLSPSLRAGLVDVISQTNSAVSNCLSELGVVLKELGL